MTPREAPGGGAHRGAGRGAGTAEVPGQDRTISTLTPRDLAVVLGPKADAAWHLHQQTASSDIRAFGA